MARKPKPVSLDGETHWISVDLVAGLLGTTRLTIAKRALAGEFLSNEDAYRQPCRNAEMDIAPLRAARLAAERAKSARTLRPKSAAQLGAEWSKISAQNARERRIGGMFQEHHLRVTLLHQNAKIIDPPIDNK